LGFLKWFTVEAIHCQDAFSLVMEHKNGWKLVFSGDTRPNQALVEAGKECTLLIHEATFEDDLEEEAINKYHSTTKEALLVSTQMKAKFLILNHFSQRYPKIPTVSAQSEKSVMIAFDLMTVTFDRLRILPTLLPILKCMFREEIMELLESENKRSGVEHTTRNK
jgi:ribonuclease Z